VLALLPCVDSSADAGGDDADAAGTDANGEGDAIASLRGVASVSGEGLALGRSECTMLGTDVSAMLGSSPGEPRGRSGRSGRSLPRPRRPRRRRLPPSRCSSAPPLGVPGRVASVDCGALTAVESSALSRVS
jgi:hypothetical protein